MMLIFVASVCVERPLPLCVSDSGLRKRRLASFGADSPFVNLGVRGTRNGDPGVRCDATSSPLASRPAAKCRGHIGVEEHWRQFFSDPSQWWDHTIAKINPHYPDFKHKQTGTPLWIDGRSNPSWVKIKLASMTPGSVPRSLHSWNTLISESVKSGRGQNALKLYEQMQAEGVEPDAFTFARVLTACTNLTALEEGRRVHHQAIESGCHSDMFVGNILVDMYCRCGRVGDAERVFNAMPVRDVVSWNAMLAGYVKCDEGQKALELFTVMQEEGLKPNPITFVAVLNACSSIMALEEGRCVHALVIQSGCFSDVFVGNSLVDMYAKCRSMEDAQDIFLAMPTYNVVSWSAMLSGYVKCKEGKKALEMFSLMQKEGVNPNAVTFVAVLNACAIVMELEEGRRLHALVIQSGYESVVFVGNALVDMYVKCGSIEDAQRVFQTMPSRNVVSWSVMVAGYVKYELGQRALKLFALMQEEGVKPNTVTFVAVLNACANVMVLEDGMCVHAQAIQSGCESGVFVGNALVDMYAKCGSIEDAQRVFCAMPDRDVVSWNAMLGGFAMHGHGKEAVELFQEMYRSGMEINAVTFIGLLSACSRGGLVEEGVSFFESMQPVYGVSPTVEHYACMIDLLSRAGLLSEAESLITREPTVGVDSIALIALLGACRNQSSKINSGDRERGSGILA